MLINRQTTYNTTPLIDLPVPAPVSGSATDWPAGSYVRPHHHSTHQLIYAATGVMTVEAAAGIWVVPPTRAVWVPAHTGHSINMSGFVQLRTVQFAENYVPIDATECSVVQVSPLLRAGIIRAIEFPAHYPADSPEGHLAAVIFHETKAADIAPLHLPMPTDPRARQVAQSFCADPANRQACAVWAKDVGASERTLERHFRAGTGMSFGKWQQQARLLKALEILAAGQPVTTAAFEVGFKSPSAFIVMFKSAMGETPSRYFLNE